MNTVTAAATRHGAATAVLAVLVLAVSACGGGDDGENSGADRYYNVSGNAGGPLDSGGQITVDGDSVAFREFACVDQGDGTVTAANAKDRIKAEPDLTGQLDSDRTSVVWSDGETTPVIFSADNTTLNADGGSWVRQDERTALNAYKPRCAHPCATRPPRRPCVKDRSRNHDPPRKNPGDHDAPGFPVSFLQPVKAHAVSPPGSAPHPRTT